MEQVMRFCAIVLVLTSPLCGGGSVRDACTRCELGTMTHGGIERSYIIHEPARRPAGPVPLVLVMHGGGGNAAGMIRLTRGRFNELADRDGFIVLYPEGVGKHWNDSRADPIDRAHRENIDDVGFLSRLIDEMVKNRGSDPGRVFATGISNGGFMSLRLACELSGKIRGIAAVTASMPANPRSECSPERPVPVLIINGTADPLVPYDGGPVRVLGMERGRALSTADTVRFWLKRNGCGDKEVTARFPDTNPGDESTVVKHMYQSSGGGPCVGLYSVEGGGHTWPGGWQYLGKRIIGPTNRDINACDEIWDFFRQLR